MAIHHLKRPAGWYAITREGTGLREGSLNLYSDEVGGSGRIEARAEWVALSKRGHGWGFTFGRNGAESDCGLDLYAGRLGSVWLRLRSPWTRWLNVRDHDKPGWHYPRHTGIRFHNTDGHLVTLQLDSGEMGGKEVRREVSVYSWNVLGRTEVERVEGASGMTNVPLPEGNYPATWTEQVRTWRHVRFPGTWRDAILGCQVRRSVKLDIPGGIPVEGKGENSWDCGMDGIFGTSGDTVAEAVAHAVKAVLRDRDRYGGPHNLPRPMSVREASRG